MTHSPSQSNHLQSESVDLPGSPRFSLPCRLVGIRGFIGVGKDTCAKMMGDYMEEATSEAGISSLDTSSVDISSCEGETSQSEQVSSPPIVSGPSTHLSHEGLPFWHRLAFADELKIELAHSLGISVDVLYDRLAKEAYRDQMRTLGSERRAQNLDYWIEKVQARCERFPAHLHIVTDVRHHNEARWIVEQGGALVHVVRPGYGASGVHESETQLQDVPCDFRIHNDGGRPYLCKQIRRLMRRLGWTLDALAQLRPFTYHHDDSSTELELAR